jgi:hypothetical protein
MPSAWGSSWGFNWGDSWGPLSAGVVTEGGSGNPVRRKRKKPKAVLPNLPPALTIEQRKAFLRKFMELYEPAPAKEAEIREPEVVYAAVIPEDFRAKLAKIEKEAAEAARKRRNRNLMLLLFD